MLMLVGVGEVEDETTWQEVGRLGAVTGKE